MNNGIIKNILKFYIPSIISFLLGMLSAVVLTRVFEPSVYGTLNVFNNTSALVLSISYLGLDAAYIRFYNETPNGFTPKDLCYSLLSICVVILGVAGFIITSLFFEDFTKHIFGFPSRLICMALFCNVGAQLILRFFLISYRMNLDTKKYAIVTILMQVATKFCVVLAALFTADITRVVFFNTIGIFGMMLFMMGIYHDTIIPQNRKRISWKRGKEVFRYGALESPVPIITQLNLFLSQQIIKFRFGMEGVGIYSSANYFLTIFGVLQSGFATFWSAFVYANYKKERTLIKQIHDYLFMAVIFAYGLLILSKDIIYLLIGKDYHDSKEFFALILFYPAMILLTETTGCGINIEKKNHISLLINLLVAVVNLMAAYLLAPVWNLKGVAAAYGCSGLLYYIASTIFGQKYYSSIVNLKKSILGLLILVSMFLTCFFMQGGRTYFYIIAELIFAGTLYKNELKTIISKTKNIVKGRIKRISNE